MVHKEQNKSSNRQNNHLQNSFMGPKKACRMGSKAWVEPRPCGSFSKRQGRDDASKALKWEDASVKPAKVGQILL